MRTRTRRSQPGPSAMPDEWLHDQIAMLEKRLQQIGPDGDCGYEKAMVRFLEQQLGMRRAQLQSLR